MKNKGVIIVSAICFLTLFCIVGCSPFGINKSIEESTIQPSATMSDVLVESGISEDDSPNISIDFERMQIGVVQSEGLSEIIGGITTPISFTQNRNVALIGDIYYYWRGSDLILLNRNTGEEKIINSGEIAIEYYDDFGLYNFDNRLFIGVDVLDAGPGASTLLYDFENGELYQPYIDAYRNSELTQMSFVDGLPDYNDRYYIFQNEIQFDQCIIGGIADFQSTDKEYFVYDFVSNEMHPLPQFEYEYIQDESICFNDDYIFLVNSDNAYTLGQKTEYAKMYIISRNTFKGVVDFDLTQISPHKINLFKIEDGIMYFYCEDNSQIIEFDTTNGLATVTTEFGHDSHYIDYDADEDCLYLRLNVDFNYVEDAYQLWRDMSGLEYNYGDFVEYENINDAKIVYIKFNLKDGSYEVLRTNPLKEHLSDSISSRFPDYTRIGDDIFEYNFDWGYSIFSGMFKYK